MNFLKENMFLAVTVAVALVGGVLLFLVIKRRLEEHLQFHADSLSAVYALDFCQC